MTLLEQNEKFNFIDEFLSENFNNKNNLIYRYIGYENKEKYIKMLLNFKNYSSKYDNEINFLSLFNSLNTNFNDTLCKNIINKFKKINLNNISKENIKYCHNEVNNSNFRIALEKVYELYLTNKNTNNINIIANFLTVLTLWSCEILKKFDLNKNSKVVFYGPIRENEVYFLILLSFLGVKVLYLNSSTDNTFSKIDFNQSYSILIENSITEELNYEEILNQKTQNTEEIRIKTIAQQATEEINEILGDINNGIVKPWQLNSLKTKIVSLDSTIDEIEIYLNEPNRLRPNFKIDTKVYLPVFFTNVNGIFKDKKKYVYLIKKIKDSTNSLFLENRLLNENLLERTEICKFAFYLNNNKINSKISDVLNSSKFNFLEKITKENIIFKIEEFLNSDLISWDKEKKVTAIASILNMPNNIIQLLHIYDFSNIPPKIIYYFSENIDFNEQEIYLLGFLHFIGFDIILFNPSGQVNLQNYINNSAYISSHKLEEYSFNFNFRQYKDSKSFFNSILKIFN